MIRLRLPLAFLALCLSFTPASAQDKTQDDIRATLGLVPQFMKSLPEAALPGAWQEMKSLELNPDTAIPPKYKELIGLAVAAQVPCSYCVYFHTKAAQVHGATEQEVREAVAMASLTRHWSTVLNGAQIDQSQFRRETDQIMRNFKQKAQKQKQMGGQAGEEPSASQAQGPITEDSGD